MKNKYFPLTKQHLSEIGFIVLKQMQAQGWKPAKDFDYMKIESTQVSVYDSPFVAKFKDLVRARLHESMKEAFLPPGVMPNPGHAKGQTTRSRTKKISTEQNPKKKTLPEKVSPEIKSVTLSAEQQKAFSIRVKSIVANFGRMALELRYPQLSLKKGKGKPTEKELLAEYTLYLFSGIAQGALEAILEMDDQAIQTILTRADIQAQSGQLNLFGSEISRGAANQPEAKERFLRRVIAAVKHGLKGANLGQYLASRTKPVYEPDA